MTPPSAKLAKAIRASSSRGRGKVPKVVVERERTPSQRRATEPSMRDSTILRLWAMNVPGEEIATMFGISRQRVYQIVNRWGDRYVDVRALTMARKLDSLGDVNPINLLTQIEPHLLDQEVLTAFLVAQEAHQGQYRQFAAEPYIFHPVRVAVLVSRQEGATTKHVAAALLHDVLEDTHVTTDDLLGYPALTEPTIATVLRLTKTGRDPYAEFIAQVVQDEDARMVKRADVLDNLSTLPSGDPRMKKYLAALDVLSS